MGIEQGTSPETRAQAPARRMSRWLAAFALLAFALASVTAGLAALPRVARAATATNLALNKTAVADSQEADSVRASNATDGDTTSSTSRWGSTNDATANTEGGPHWIYVDLGSEQDVAGVRVYWEQRKAKGYKIQVATTSTAPAADSADWKDVYTNADRPATKTDAITFTKQKARFVRLYIEKNTYADPDGGTAWGAVSIYELEVFATADEADQQDPSENVALNKTASADTSETANFGAAKAFDGDTTSTASRWASGADATSAKDGGPHWLAVDLGKEQNVKTIRLFWEQRKAKGYKVQIATGDSMPAATDTSAWEDVYTHEGNPTTKNETIKLNEVKRARYVRLYIDANQFVDPDGGASWGTVSLFEMEVYGGEPALSMNDLANEIQVKQPAKGDTKLKVELPTSDTYDVTYNGTDYEQVIGPDLTIYQPVVDTTVKASFKVAKKSDPTNYVFREINVTVPGAYTKATGDNAAPAVLPELREWKGESGTFQITDASRVLYGDADFKAAAEELAADYKDLFGKELTVASGTTANAGDIVLTKAGDDTPGLGDEGYYMTIDDGITVKASAKAGAYWSTRTILQALKLSGNGTIAKGITRDYPLYKVRGLILDVGRKTFTLDFLKQMVKQLSWYKLNDFQVHLNDNYIWVEEYNEGKAGMDADSWKLPYSGFRLESDIKKGGNDGKNQADLTSTDVWYSKADFRSFIKDSRDLGVNIVPEFDMPAHSLALTKVRPDLRTPTSTIARGNDHLDLKNKYSESLAFALSIWDEYLKGDDPVFDAQTVVHIGADEFEADGTAYRKFVKDLFEHVESTGRTARVWGSLDRIKGTVDVTGKAADGTRRQMNIWSTGWAKFDTMYKAGFDLINCIDSTYYIVPNAGYYADYLNQNTMYNGNINTLGGVTIPAGDQQMIGGAFAVWNDMTYTRENGISEYDVYDRITKAASMYTASVWGRGSMTVEQAKASAATLGDAPQTNFGYEVKKTDDGTVAQYKMNDAKDASGNAADLKLADGATIADVDGTKALKLDGKTAYATTGLGTVGLGNDLRVKVKRTSSSADEQILFESDYGQIKAVQAKTGQVGITRENHDYSFNYTLPVNEWVELEFKNVQNKTSLYVDGKLVETIGLDGGNKLKATCMFPVERIGSKTAAFQGYVDDLRISTAKDYASTIEVDHLLVIARAVLQNTESAELKALVEQGQGLVEQMDPNADEITGVAGDIKQALSGLEYQKADYAAVDALIAAVNDLDLSAYKDDDVAQLREAISAVTRDLPVAMQADVDASYRGIQEAIANLEKKTDEDRYATGMTATACSKETSSENSPASNAVDGNEATIWHTKYSGGGDTDADHWLNVKLEKPLTVDKFVYVPRSGAVNGRLNKYRVEVKTEGSTTYQTVASGTVSDNSKTSTFTFNAVANVTDVKLVFVGKGQGGFASAAEVKVHYAETPATKTELDAAIKKADGLAEDDYTDASWATFNEALENARTVSGKTDATAKEIDGALSALVSAQLGLKVSEAIQPVGKGTIEAKGTSVRYPAKNEDVATSLAGLRFGYTFTLPAGATLDEDQTGWYYGASEDAVEDAVEKQDTTHFAKALNRKAVDGNANAFVSNIVFTRIPSANYCSKLFAQAQLAYKLKGSDHAIIVTGKIRSDSAVDWAGRVPPNAGEAKTLADAIRDAAPKVDAAK